MTVRPLRIVLAFYPSADTPGEQAAQSLSRIARVCRVGADAAQTSAPCQKYAPLRLQGETLIVAETEPANLESVVTNLRLTGSPAIFVARPTSEETWVSGFSTERKARALDGPLTRRAVVARLQEDNATLALACGDLSEAARLGHALSPASGWILDNSYLVETQIAEVQRHLPRVYSAWAAGSGRPTVYELAQDLVSKSSFLISETTIRDYLRETQTSWPLSIAELWAFPLFLRVALIEALTALAVRVSQGQLLRESAYLWANRLAVSAREGPEIFDAMLRRLETEPVAQQPYFITALAEQLQDEELALGPARHWVEERFGESLVQVVRAQHTREASETIATSNAFGSLRVLARLQFATVFEEVSEVDAELRKDPDGIYQNSDFATRDLCRRSVEKLAHYSRRDEREIAEAAVRLAGQGTDARTRHVAWYLLSGGLPQLEAETGARLPIGPRMLRSMYRRPTPFYLTATIGLTICFALLACVVAWEAGVHRDAFLAALAILSLFPLGELAVQIVNVLVISLLSPEPLSKLDFRKGIPSECATLVVIPMMLVNAETVRAEVEKLEVRYLGNRDRNVFFGLFSDFIDASQEITPDDEVLVGIAREGIAELNRRHPLEADAPSPQNDRFLLFHRGRTWSESEQSWIGRERKRGKIEDLNAFLCGAAKGALDTGRLSARISYVITLDADTQLPPEAARRLIETIAHPLNHVEIDPQTHTRTRGYAIIQPRVSITLPGATATRFTRVFADATGTDPYSRTVSDAQQDLFLEAIFHGKAIYDVRAFHSILENRFPSDTILSHDLIEGAHAGVGLASDIELFEHLPVGYGAFAVRQHRWVRGDWQIARWAFGRVPAGDGTSTRNPLTAINRWRILDNLRRSLTPVAALLLLLLGWLISAAPGVWSLVVGLAVAIPAFAPLLDRLARRLQGTVHRWQGAADEFFRTIVMLAFLPHQAWLSVDAISRVFYRRSVSHRKLLEWQTAAHAGNDSRRHSNATFRQLLIISGLSLALTIILLVRGDFAPTSIFVILWAASPLLMRWLSSTAPSRAARKPGAAEMLFLRRTARETWRFFDDLVCPQTNWLPPDNTQLALRVEVAERTSPTNIGLWLTSALAARDFGYITPDEFCRRCSRTMETLGRLELYEGHLLNWYDTSTLEPLNPRYVSTVDSGNLVAALWVLQQGCNEILNAPLVGHVGLRGLHDTLSILEEKCGDDPSVAGTLQTLRRLLRGTKEGHHLLAHYRIAMVPMQKLQEAQRWHFSVTDERRYWASRLSAELASWTATVERYLAWMETLASPPDSTLLAIGKDAAKVRRRALRQMPSLKALAEGRTLVDQILTWRQNRDLRPELVAWIDQLSAEYELSRANAVETMKSFEAVSASAGRIADGINMGFLYDAHRKLFGVGYAVGGPREFTSHYDLIASECRLASLVSIAKGEVPVEHWFALNRPWSYTDSGQTLLSWSGTTFEYLMPLLFTRTFTNSMLEYACRDAVERQIEYGDKKEIPWGISESAYSALDVHQIYQYKPFGIPALALNPGFEDQLVVSPYSSALALLVDPSAAVDNLQRLKSLGMKGPMGFYESIDFSRESRKDGSRGVHIYCYMAHHQGMSLAALNNVVHRDAMQRRFHQDLRIRSVETLLFEGIPISRLPLVKSRPGHVPIRSLTEEEAIDRIWTEETAAPRVHLHGNGRYALMVTNSGGGYSRWNDFDITRWRSDTALDPWGSFIYIRDLKSDEVWSASHKPLASTMGEIVVRFAADRAEIRRRVGGVETTLDITVAAEDDVELRRMRITNRSLRGRQVELTSYMELAMAPHAADKAHPAFAKMFIETEYPEKGILLAHRRPRSPGETPVWTAHCLVVPEGVEGIQCETDRGRFLGRGKTAENPDAIRGRLSGSVGTVIDPIFSLRCRVNLDPRERQELTFVTIAGSSRDAVLALAHKYAAETAISRAFEMAWTRAQLEFRFLGIGPGVAHLSQELVSQLVYPNPRLRPPADRLVRNRLGQEDLWAYGISGDLPMLVITLSDSRNLSLVREVLLAHAYWRLRGFKADIIILNQEAPSYDQPLRTQILRQIEAHAADAGMDRPGGVFLRDWHAIPEDHRTLILASASIVLSGARGSLQQQMVAAVEGLPIPAFVASGGHPEEPSVPLPFLELPYFNGIGGFSQDGREYAIYMKPGDTTPSPWVNVMANANFGTMVTDSGLGFTWSGNSQSNRLTPWHNDPVADIQSEVVYLRDDESGAIWTPTALPRREKDAYRARHGNGYTVFEHNSHAISQELTVFVPIGDEGSGDPVKICRLRLRNDSSRPRVLTVTWFAEWVLGSNREDQQLHVQASRDNESGALLARQYWSGAWRGQHAFAATTPKAASWSTDRIQVLGRNGSLSSPEALRHIRLDNRPGPASDPCAALQLNVRLDQGGQTEVTFLIGQTDTIENVRALIARYEKPAQVESALVAARQWWDSTLTAIQVHTPVRSIDLLLNRWLLYQSMSCRFWGRSAFYQSGGAFGFRDQLQDSMAFVYTAPGITRKHIVRCAARQFPEGDVQHWWHAETGNGVRTLCSDDLLWLPFTVAQYVKVTGDTGVLDEIAPFLDGPPLGPGEHEKMFIPHVSSESGTVWEHCIRAIDHAWQLGPHELPLMGNGDWNDGMNLVGVEGRGESVWLGWFLCTVLETFAGLAEAEPSRADRAPKWRRQAAGLKRATEQTAWDGEWYMRAYFDDGSPLGSHVNEEAKIDSLPQSWAVISGAADSARTLQAMKSAESMLVREKDKLVALFTPPFDHSQPNPGYIMGYPPGLRENGGQYTHGSLWMAFAWARLQEGASAVRLLQIMNPIELSRHPEDSVRYRGEPYVVTADVSTAKGHVGRSGWTWYTGSAAWMYRIWVEEVLGLEVRGDKLSMHPAIPDEWPGFELTYRYKSTVYEIRVSRAESAGMEMDGVPAPEGFVQLRDTGGTRHVSVSLPHPVGPASAKSRTSAPQGGIATLVK